MPAAKTPKAAFDDIVVAVLEDIESRWHDELGLVEFAVEETPLVPDDWDTDTVPLASLVRGTGGEPTRLVLFRRPIELRSETRADLEAMVLTVLVEQVSELLGRSPEEIDPRYDAGDDGRLSRPPIEAGSRLEADPRGQRSPGCTRGRSSRSGSAVSGTDASLRRRR